MSDVTKRQVIPAIRVAPRKHYGPVPQVPGFGTWLRADNFVVISVLSECCLWCESRKFFAVLRTSSTLRGGWFVIPTSCAHSCDVWHDILEVAGEFRVWGCCLLGIANCLWRLGTTIVLMPWVEREHDRAWVICVVYLVALLCLVWWFCYDVWAIRVCYI